MSTVGPVRAFSMSVASGVTLSSSLDLGGAYGKVMLGIPTMPSGSDIRIWAAPSEDATYRKVFHKPEAVSAVVVALNFDSSITDCFVPIDMNAQFVKFELGTFMTEHVTTFDVICGAN